MRIVVTGATGYIGARLVSLGLSRGHSIVMASRHARTTYAPSSMHFDLSSDSSIELPKDIDAIVHLAANTTHNDHLKDECEVLAAHGLIQSAQNVAAKFIFVSSQTARPDAPTSYGRTKWRIEQKVLSAGGWVVRPGQVYGGQLRGLFGKLVQFIRRTPILPAFIPPPKVQPIHVDDLAEGLLRIVERHDLPSGIYCLGAPEPVSFSIFLHEIAKYRLRYRRGFLPVPVVFIRLFILIFNKTKHTRLELERLRSLFDLPVMACASDLNQLGLKLRPLHSGMHPSGNNRRRCLLQEGRALLTYVFKHPPSSTVLRRYIRAIERLRGGHALGLPKLFLDFPLCLSFLDESAWVDKKLGMEFSLRLDTATLLAEATPSGAHHLFRLDCKYRRLNSIQLVCSAVACEVFWRVLRTAFLPVVRLFLRRTRGDV